MKILIFLHGTSIMHKSAAGHSREDIVKQAKAKDPSVHEYDTYVPVGNVVKKLESWENQGAEIIYLSSHKTKDDLAKDKFVLHKHHFPEGRVYYRKSEENYKDIAESIKPDILIEDDCESIGGKREMTYTYINPKLKKGIKLIEVKEFEGIDHLPNSLKELSNF